MKKPPLKKYKVVVVVTLNGRLRNLAVHNYAESLEAAETHADMVWTQRGFKVISITEVVK